MIFATVKKRTPLVLFAVTGQNGLCNDEHIECNYLKQKKII